jgi:hypothetical protein
LGERLLGAKAVAERYLENRPKSWQEEGEETEEGQIRMMKKKKKEGDVEERVTGDDEEVEEIVDRKRAGVSQSSSSLNSSTIIPSQKPLVSTGSHLKSRPALAQLSDLDDFWGPSKQTTSTSRPTSPHSLAPIDPPLPSSSTVNPNSGQTLSSSRRRVSEPVFCHSQPIKVPPSNPHLYHSSFSLTSLSSLSPSSSQDCPQSCCSTHFV